jgi:peroxiredoxin
MLQQRKGLSSNHRASLRTKQHSRRVVRARAEVSAFAKLEGVQVLRATNGESVLLRGQWGKEERVVLSFTRSLGCPFCQELAIQLRRDVKPKLDDMGVGLWMVTIGTPEKSIDFCRKTGFPIENLLLDPDQDSYRALDLKSTVQDTFFNPATPLSLLKRAVDGQAEDLMAVLSSWNPLDQPIPPKGPIQALQQGGLFLFEGPRMLYARRDEATAAHVDSRALQDLLALIKTSCECNMPSS